METFYQNEKLNEICLVAFTIALRWVNTTTLEATYILPPNFPNQLLCSGNLNGYSR